MKRGILGFLIIFLPLEFISGQQKSSYGNFNESIVCKGIQRNFILHLPGNTSEFGLRPLVIALHGGGGDAEGMVKLTKGKFNKLADKDGFIVIYPDGFEKHWNDGRKGEETGYRSQEQEVDDIGFISDLIDKMIRERKADSSRVYVTGMSNGAMMSYRCGCELSEKIAAIAPVAGNIPENLAHVCKPVRPVSVLAINNTKDPLMPYDGGEVTGPFGKKKIGKVLSAEKSIEFWVKFNGCKSEPIKSELPDKDSKDGTTIQLSIFNGGISNSEVLFYTIEGGGHTWPGGYPYLGEWIIGKTSGDMDACEVIWEFFKRH